MRLRGYYRGARDKNRISAVARGCLRCDGRRARIRVRPRETKGGSGGERGGERRTRNNQRADRTDEWDTTVEDIVRSIDGIGVCNVN